MEVLEFRKIRKADNFNKKYLAWSRIYEYPLVLENITRYMNEEVVNIHNSSWGFTGCHITFKDDLDNLYSKCVHSDIKPSLLSNTEVWDITKKPKNEWKNNFDVVINVSTLEEVDFDHIEIFNNLLAQVRDNGLLICTFDLPGLDLERFEELFGREIKSFDDDLTNSNSTLPAFVSTRHLECGIMVIRK